MLWLVFAIGCAILGGIAAIFQKRILKVEHAMEFMTVFAIINFAFSIVLLPFIDLTFDLWVWIIIYIAAWFGAIAALMVTKSLRHAPISKISPMMNVEPVVIVILAYFLLTEHLSFQNYVGVGLIVLASNFLGGKKFYWHPFKHIKHFTHSKYSVLCVVGMVFYAISSILDKFVMNQGVSPSTYVFLLHLFLAIDFLILLALFHDGFHGIHHGIQKAGKWIILVSLITVGYRVLQMEALSMAYVSLVIPIKRMSTLFATIFGGTIYKEKDIMTKSLACIVMILGAVFVIS
ncbi:MAG: DMT family transporter [Nanoarchaeota archaeon]|nr:DMT family transporter [Nanoarchaeota archaeon]